MSLVNIDLSYKYIPDFDRGRPLANAFIYIGEPDLDPEIVANQKAITFVQEDGVPVTGIQPVRTSAGGLTTYNGSPVSVQTDGDCSIKILDSQGAQIYYSPSGNVGQALISYVLQDFVAVSAGQTVVAVPFTFTPNTGTLIVAVNGSIIESDQYTQAAGQVTFTNPLPDGFVFFQALRSAPVGTVDATNVSYGNTTVAGALGAAAIRLSTVAQMIGYSAIQGSYIETAGYISPGDDGGNLYEIVAGGTGTDDGGSYIDLDNGLQAKALFPSGVNVKQFGARGDNSNDDAAAIQAAIDFVDEGVVRVPAGIYLTSAKISVNKSNFKLIGEGRASSIKPTGGINTAIEINNGSWNDATGIYTLSGTSIGNTAIESIEVNGFSAGACDGVVMARATVGCYLRDVFIVGFNGYGLRTYGAWYSNLYQVVSSDNTHNWSYGYENNDFSMFGCDFISNPANQSLTHGSSHGGTCRNMNFYGCGWDGMPQTYGVHWKGVHALNFFGGYLEAYDSDVVKTANAFEFGENIISVVLGGLNMIAGTDYSGTWLKLGMDAVDFARNVSIDGCFQYNSGANTSVAVDTSFAQGVKFGTNRFEQGFTINDVVEVTPEKEAQVYVPATTGADEVTIPIATIRKGYTIPVTRIRLTVLTDGATLATQYLRVLNQGTGDILINFPMPTTLTAGDTFDLTDDSLSGYVTSTGEPSINSQLAEDTVLVAYTYKAGSPQDWPNLAITVESL